jgi:hypothetical protein
LDANAQGLESHVADDARDTPERAVPIIEVETQQKLPREEGFGSDPPPQDLFSPTDGKEDRTTPAPKEGELDENVQGLKSPAAVETKTQHEFPPQEDEDCEIVQEPISPRFYPSLRLNFSGAENRSSDKKNSASKQRENLEMTKKQIINDKRKKTKKHAVERRRNTTWLTAEQEQVFERQNEQVDLDEYV